MFSVRELGRDPTAERGRDTGRLGDGGRLARSHACLEREMNARGLAGAAMNILRRRGTEANATSAIPPSDTMDVSPLLRSFPRVLNGLTKILGSKSLRRMPNLYPCRNPSWIQAWSQLGNLLGSKLGTHPLDRDGEIAWERFALSDEKCSVVRTLLEKKKFRVNARDLAEIP
ncbi:hypothetical protein PRIPAC_85734 [Pristionchus pacificus]|uniref:Uncharacterized protein n=1 Tax=Pristionchus pacificus TaxID=54126 RepID=A0A2A6BLQ3_PRIPA|nr:hypothetical protein PRIPAC_85734 [Pristionchus pacificus]|eukprot:PDM66850.1 hypothetical protein PRIPAC_48267 [Pristionchus pacificus]